MQERKEVRCGHCNRLLGKGEVRDFEIKCPRCKTINHVRAQSPCSEPPEGREESLYESDSAQEPSAHAGG